jgi:uncharacterized protein (DUF58 family)
MGLRQRARQWWLARLPATDTWQLSQRNIYILPTKAGLVFAATLVVMLVASINYQLNLGYILTFLLAGSGLVSMHLTHGNLRGLQLRLRAGPAAHAGEPALLDVVCASPAGTRQAVALRFEDVATHGERAAWCDVPGGGSQTLRLALVPATRGWHAVPLLRVETSFPLGLFRAWSHWRPALRVLAYPRPENPAPALPPASLRASERPQRSHAQGTELDGVRPWRRGDSMRQVAWKKVARAGELISRDTSTSGTRELVLDWAASTGAGVSSSDTEARLSRLATWVLRAEREGLAYGLSLPGQDHLQAIGQGEAHQRRALHALAEWG